MVFLLTVGNSEFFVCGRRAIYSTDWKQKLRFTYWIVDCAQVSWIAGLSY